MVVGLCLATILQVEGLPIIDRAHPGGLNTPYVSPSDELYWLSALADIGGGTTTITINYYDNADPGTQGVTTEALTGIYNLVQFKDGCGLLEKVDTDN